MQDVARQEARRRLRVAARPLGRGSTIRHGDVMPVLDHDIHPSTQRGEDHRYGCWNQSIRQVNFYWSNLAQCHVPSRMSKECRYDKSLTDRNCEGCKRRGSGEAYDQRIREQSK